MWACFMYLTDTETHQSCQALTRNRFRLVPVSSLSSALSVSFALLSATMSRNYDLHKSASRTETMKWLATRCYGSLVDGR